MRKAKIMGIAVLSILVIVLAYIIFVLNFKYNEEQITDNIKRVDVAHSYYEYTNTDFNQEYYYKEYSLKPIDRHTAYINGDNVISYYDIDYRYGKTATYDQYAEFCEKYNFEQTYTDETLNYFIICYSDFTNHITFRPIDTSVLNIVNEDYNVLFYIEDKEESDDCTGYIFVMPTDKDDVSLYRCVSHREIQQLKLRYSNPFYLITRKIMDDASNSIDKPVIYLYPDETTNINVQVELNNAEFSCTYPTYNNGWNVIADTDGTLHIDNQEYTYLYWEANTNHKYTIDSGFCIKGSDTAEFLESKLAELGLNRKEANEFIVYWLPLMEKNPYNVISFDTTQYEDLAKLYIDPEPTTLIRVYMTWYATNKYVSIRPQSITTPNRICYTVVEWGGTQINGGYGND